MSKQATFTHTAPIIKSVRFLKGKIILHLQDGRTVIIPENRFPEIERLTPQQKRRHKTLAGMGLMFDDSDTVFHVSDFLGSLPGNFAGRKTTAKASAYSITDKSKLLTAKEPAVKYRKKRKQ